MSSHRFRPGNGITPEIRSALRLCTTLFNSCLYWATSLIGLLVMLSLHLWSRLPVGGSGKMWSFHSHFHEPSLAISVSMGFLWDPWEFPVETHLYRILSNTWKLLLHHSSTSSAHLLRGLPRLLNPFIIPDTACFSNLSSGILHNICPKLLLHNLLNYIPCHTDAGH